MVLEAKKANTEMPHAQHCEPADGRDCPALRCVASTAALGAVCMPQYKTDIKLLENIHRRPTKMKKALEGKVCEEQLRSLGVFSPEQGRLRGRLMEAAAPQREQRGSAELCSV